MVTLLNGDRITGEITELKRGRLEIKTDDAGTLNVEWDKVATVDAARWFEVTTSDGWRLLGSLGRTSGRYVVIRGDDSVLPLPLSDITNIVPIGKSLWAKLDGSIDAGFTYTQSSGIAQTTLNSDTEYRRPAFAFRLTASATLTRLDDDSEPDDRAALDFSYVRYRGRRWFISGAARLESNESLGLLLRSQVGAVVGQRLVNTNRAQFEVGGGLGANHEVGVDTDPTDNIEGMLVMRTSFYSYDRPKTEFDASVQYYPNLSDWGRQRLQVDTAVKRELLKDFIVALHVYDSFDSDPPQSGAARNDVGVVASIGWTY